MNKLVIVSVLAVFISGCTPDQEAKWQAVVTAINNGVRVTTEVARQTLDEVCAQQTLVIGAAQAAISIANSQGSGPRTQSAIRNINSGIGVLIAACEGGTANVTLTQLTSRAWNAYKAIRLAQSEITEAKGL